MICGKEEEPDTKPNPDPDPNNSRNLGPLYYLTVRINEH